MESWQPSVILIMELFSQMLSCPYLMDSYICLLCPKCGEMQHASVTPFLLAIGWLDDYSFEFC